MTIGVKVYQNDGFVSITATGGETSLAFDFPIFSASHIEIIRTRSGTDTTLAITTDYTIPSGSISNEAGGTVTLVSPALAGDKYALRLNVPEERTTDFNQNGDFLADTLNLQLDLITQQVQQLRRDIDRAIGLAPSSTTTGIVLPEPEASKVVGWNAAANQLINYTPNTAAYLNVSAYIQTLLDDANSSTALTTLGFSTYGKTLIDDATASDALTTLGVSTFAKTILDDADAAAVRTTIGAAPTGAYLTGTDPVITLTTTQTVTNSDAGATGCSIEYYHNSASPALSDLQQISHAFNSSTGVKRTFNLIRAVIEDATNTSEDSRYDFQTINAGTLATRMKLAQGLVVGTPTGDDKGVGTINAVAVYDDNVLLTCYPIQKYLDGEINLTYWDEVAGGEHKPARGFVQKLQTANLIDVDAYIADWKQKKALPAFYGLENEKKPTGEIIQRLMETADLFAIHIDQLNERIKLLESSQ